MSKSSIKVVIEAHLADFWATEDQFVAMTDDEILELIKEDYYALLENADIKVIRSN